MKIEYFESKNYYQHFNFAQGVALRRTNIKINPNKKVKTFTKYLLSLFLLSVIMLVDGAVLFSYGNKIIFNGFMLFIGLIIIWLMYLLLEFRIFYVRSKESSFRQVITVSKSGISEKTDGMKIRGEWDKVDLIVVQNNVAVILLKKSSLIFFFEVLDEQKFIDTVRKYDENVFISYSKYM